MYELTVKVKNEEALYNNFDASGTSLSNDLTEYLYEQLGNRELGEKLRIIFNCNSQIDEDRLNKAFNNFFDSWNKSTQKQIKTERATSLYLLLVGVVFVVAGIVLESHINTVIATIISTVGSFSIWEAANIWIKVLPNLKIKSRIAKYLKDYELVITNK